MRILIVEDEPQIARQISHRLQHEGYLTELARDGEEGLYLGKEYPFDCAVVDIGLPKLSGIEMIRHLRNANIAFPVLILTARGAWQEKVEGLEAGADDYMVKPFHLEELVARLKALLRRASGWSSSKLQCGPIRLDLNSQTVTVNDNVVELTAYEYKALEYLMLHAGKVISKSELTEHIYDQDFERDSNVIEVFIGRLRRKLDPDGNFNPIETLRGRGYRIAAE
ncbi:MAG: DNA-binding response regulator [Gammaproteobacteria bacterium]|nr:MAG: DNA-binding response regulator [Gammaproteobacteria bacterium]